MAPRCAGSLKPIRRIHGHILRILRISSDRPCPIQERDPFKETGYLFTINAIKTIRVVGECNIERVAQCWECRKAGSRWSTYKKRV